MGQPGVSSAARSRGAESVPAGSHRRQGAIGVGVQGAQEADGVGGGADESTVRSH
jgi:hypothetical protein